LLKISYKDLETEWIILRLYGNNIPEIYIGGIIMEQLTQMELLQLHELLGAEELAVKKCNAYAEMIKDDELKPFIQNTLALHQANVVALVDLVRRHNGKEEVQQ
jgi:hypothetical protein